jgi:hypothetical protein
MKKKLISIALVLSAILTTLVPTSISAYATTYTTKATKVATCKLSGVYWYKLSIQEGKLIAEGKYERRTSPDKYTVQLQITQPVTYTGYDLGSDGIAALSAKTNISVGGRWELKTNIPVLRNAESAGAPNILLSLDLSGLAGGIYCLQEVVAEGSNKEGHYCDSTLLVMFKGVGSIQTTWTYSDLSSWWHTAGFWVS